MFEACASNCEFVRALLLQNTTIRPPAPLPDNPDPLPPLAWIVPAPVIDPVTEIQIPPPLPPPPPFEVALFPPLARMLPLNTSDPAVIFTSPPPFPPEPRPAPEYPPPPLPIRGT